MLCSEIAASGHKTLEEFFSNPMWPLISCAVSQNDLPSPVCKIRITVTPLLSHGFSGGLNRMLVGLDGVGDRGGEKMQTTVIEQ